MRVALDPELILRAYRAGIFPMGDPATGEVSWHAPDPRAVLPLERFHVPSSLERVCRSRRFTITSDRAFEAVIDGCAEREPTWITPAMRAAYVALYRRGDAHSIEAWRDGELAGGLYGVHVGGAFMGESMFHRRTDASKVCLVALVDLLRRQQFLLLDIQQLTTLLEQFGAVEISRARYEAHLSHAVAEDRTWSAGPQSVSG